MNPTIATSIATQRQQDLLATAEHYRRLRRSPRVPRRRNVSAARPEFAFPRLRFQVWLAAGRL